MTNAIEITFSNACECNYNPYKTKLDYGTFLLEIKQLKPDDEEQF